jgi:hypothetical protein
MQTTNANVTADGFEVQEGDHVWFKDWTWFRDGLRTGSYCSGFFAGIAKPLVVTDGGTMAKQPWSGIKFAISDCHKDLGNCIANFHEWEAKYLASKNAA